MSSTSPQSMTLSVVSHGHEALLHRLLTDLSSCEGISSARIVVTLNLAEEKFDPGRFPTLNIQVLRNSVRKGFGANHNQAFAICDTTWFFILNPDLRLPDKDCFQVLLHAAARMPDAALLAPRIEGSSGNKEDSVRFNLGFLSLLRRASTRRQEQPDATIPAKYPHPFYWLAGMFLMVKADEFRKLGGFDERYFLYCEDYDLSARTYIAGNSIALIASTRAIHDAQRDSHRSFSHLKLHLTSLLRVWTSRAFWRIYFKRRPEALR